MEDKSLTLGVLKRHKAAIIHSFSMTQKTTNLCEGCKKFDFWSGEPIMRENLATLMSKIHHCELHRIVFLYFLSKSYNDLDTKDIWRSDSSLFRIE